MLELAAAVDRWPGAPGLWGRYQHAEVTLRDSDAGGVDELAEIVARLSAGLQD